MAGRRRLTRRTVVFCLYNGLQALSSARERFFFGRDAEELVSIAEFSPDATQVMTISDKGTARRSAVATGKILPTAAPAATLGESASRA